MTATIDWQFWVATAVAGFALIWLVRYVWRIIRPAKRSRVRASLTVDGKPARRS